MWALQFHFNGSIFRNFKNQQFWNPGISWENKYKSNTNVFKPKFLFSTTALVWLTDGFHLFQFFALNSTVIAVTIEMCNSNIWSFIAVFIINRTYVALLWWLFFDKILMLKKEVKEEIVRVHLNNNILEIPKIVIKEDKGNTKDQPFATISEERKKAHEEWLEKYTKKNSI